MSRDELNEQRLQTALVNLRQAEEAISHAAAIIFNVTMEYTEATMAGEALVEKCVNLTPLIIDIVNGVGLLKLENPFGPGIADGMDRLATDIESEL